MIYIITLLCLLSLITPAFANKNDLSVGFIYNMDIPEESFYLFDWLVVDPKSNTLQKLKDEKFYMKKIKAKLIAYVNIGEVDKDSNYYKKINPNWILGDNPHWKSRLLDIRNKDYQRFLFDEIFDKLSEYDGFFLDTLDSYQLVLKDEKERKDYEIALVEFIKSLRTLYPNKLIITNRCFEIINQIKGDIDAFVAESLFYGLNFDKGISYKKMKPEDTKWLLDKLNYVKSLGVRVIVIDYVDPKERKLQKEIAKKIYQLGFIPYVTDKFLQTIGTGIYQLKPRKILLIHDGQIDPIFSEIHRLIQPWIEYLGYVPILRNIEQVMRENINGDFSPDQYVGIILNVKNYKNLTQLYHWLSQKKDDGMKIFFFESIPFIEREDYLKRFGIKKIGQLNPFDHYIIEKSTFNFFETKPHFDDIPMLVVENPIYYIKAVSNNKGFYPLVITEWGGYALPGSFYVHVKNELFVINPTDFFSQLFKPDFPIPDVTTENGRRILTAHIDGDSSFGVADFDPSKNLMEIIRDEIIKKYPVPHTVSIIEGEISSEGLYSEKSKVLEEIARSIFNLENVEPASHSFSHPFNWQKLERFNGSISELKPQGEDLYNLKIPGYTFNLEREIFGSINYINKNLSLDQKNKQVRVFLWTGDCVPPLEAIKLTYRAGVYNVNGGYTLINKKEPYFSLIGPMGFDRNGYFQIYAPILNENIYTDLFTNYYGYVRVIQTFQMTELPFRLKPIGIYYHFYSGQKIATLKALKEVYEYALSKRINPMFLSEYAQRVLEFRNMAIAVDIRDDNLIIRSEGNLKTLRLDKVELYPDILNSKGIVGFSIMNNRIYLNLDNSGDYKIIFSNKEPNFYLLSSNGQILESYKNKNTFSLKLKAYLPLEYEIFMKDGCYIKTHPKPDILSKTRQIINVKYNHVKEGRLDVICE